MYSRKSIDRDTAAEPPSKSGAVGPIARGAASRHAVGLATGAGPAMEGDAPQGSEWLDELKPKTTSEPPKGAPLSTKKQADVGRGQAVESRRGSHR